MKSGSAVSSDDRQTLLDRFRAGGLAEEMIAETERKVRIRKRRRRNGVRSAAAAVLVAASLVWAIPYFKDTQALSIPTAERRSIALADGSRAELNANTKLTTDFRYGRRVVRFDSGEGFFSVRSDPAHPFVVETSAGTIRVTGTEFNVRLADGRAEVTLVEGQVALEPAQGAAVPLAPGEQATLGDAKLVATALAPSDLDRVLAWRRGKIVLDDMPLTDAAARFASFHGKRIEVDPSLNHIRLGGTYSLEDLPQFIEALKQTNAVQVLSDNNSYRILPRR